MGLGLTGRAVFSRRERHLPSLVPVPGTITVQYNAQGLILLLLNHPEKVILCLLYSASAGRKMIHHKNSQSSKKCFELS